MTYNAYCGLDNHIATGDWFNVDDGILRLYTQGGGRINKPHVVFAPGSWTHIVYVTEEI